MTAPRNAAPGLKLVHQSNSFVLKILPVTTFDSRFCKRESGSAATKIFISKILQKGYSKNIFDHSASLSFETPHFPLCVE